MSESAPTTQLVAQIVSLLDGFENTSASADLRLRVQLLVPVYRNIMELGPSLIPREVASSARDRLLHYFRQYPLTVLPREELAVVAGIDEWARRVRELRVEFGWPIASGLTARQMAEADEFPLDNIDPLTLRTDDYILLSTEQDKEAAYRWNLAKRIRGESLAVRDQILKYLRANVGVPISGEELRYVARDKTEWARRVRELRTEFGWPIVTKQSGRPDLPVGMYVLEEDRQSPEHDRKIDDRVRRAVLRRDSYKCARCRWSHDLFNPSDPRHLELHHIQHHVDLGANTDDNLITLCTVCHDDWHAQSNRYRLATRSDFESWLHSSY